MDVLLSHLSASGNLIATMKDKTLPSPQPDLHSLYVGLGDKLLTLITKFSVTNGPEALVTDQ